MRVDTLVFFLVSREHFSLSPLSTKLAVEFFMDVLHKVEEVLSVPNLLMILS